MLYTNRQRRSDDFPEGSNILQKQTLSNSSYTIERIFLNKFSVEELLCRMISSHTNIYETAMHNKETDHEL